MASDLKVYIDISNGGGFQRIYDPTNDFFDGRICYNMSVENEFNSAGSCGFTVPPTNPLYNALQVLNTMVQVTMFNRRVFYGRISRISKNFYLEKQVECEGILACLNDILIMPFKYTGVIARKSLAEHIQHIMSIYNGKCTPSRSCGYYLNLGDDDRGIYDNANIYYVEGVDSAVTVWDEMNNMLNADPGRVIFPDYEYGGNQILAMVRVPIATLNTEVTAPIEFATNLLDYSEDTNVSDVYTAIYPVDENGNLIDPSADGRYSPYVWNALESQYGRIEKTVTVTLNPIAGMGITKTYEYESMIPKEGDNPRAKGWFEKDGDSYILTDDETVVSGKTYYMQVDYYSIVPAAATANYAQSVEEACRTHMQALERSLIPDISIKAVDLSWLNGFNPLDIRLGVSMPILSAPHNLHGFYVCSKVSLNLENPEDTQYTFTFSGQELKTGYGRRSEALAGNVYEIQNGLKTINNTSHPIPTNVRASANQVVVDYPTYRVVYTADGDGQTRNNLAVAVEGKS